MIRPLTIATFLLAAGSGLYLYQSKHEVQLLDRTIERTVHDTSALREQSRLLAAEWTMLNDPERLRQFSDRKRSLRTISPTQFTSVADLDSRLPAPQAEIIPPVAEASQSDAAPATAPQSVPKNGVPIAASEPVSAPEPALPIPPIPTVRPIVAITAIPHSGETKPPSETRAPSETKTIDRPAIDRAAIDRTAMARPVVPDTQSRSATLADARPSEQRAFDQRSPEQHPYDQRGYDQRSAEQRPPEQRQPEQRPYDQRPPEQRPPEQRPVPKLADARTPPRQVAFAPARPPLPAPGPVNGPPPIMPYQQQTAPLPPAPLNGSLLGVARGSLPPAPRPTPVNATYNPN